MTKRQAMKVQEQFPVGARVRAKTKPGLGTVTAHASRGRVAVKWDEVMPIVGGNVFSVEMPDGLERAEVQS